MSNKKTLYFKKINILLLTYISTNLSLAERAFASAVIQYINNHNTNNINRLIERVTYHGAPTKIGNSLINNYIRAFSNYKIAYFDVSGTTKIQIHSLLKKINEELEKDKLIILDETRSNSFERINALTSKNSGLSFSKPLVLMRKKGAVLSYHVLPAGYLVENGITQKTILEVMQKDIAKQHNTVARNKRSSSEEYRAGKTVYVYFSHTTLSCPLATEVAREFLAERFYFKENSVRDMCERSASYTARFRVDYLPSSSVQQGDAISAVTGKIIRISSGVEGEPGGAGWHLANSLNYLVRPYSSASIRNTWFGPFAHHYQTKIEPSDIEPSDNKVVRLIDHMPKNRNQEERIEEESSVATQQGYSTNLQVGMSGPTVGLTHHQATTVTNRVALKYDIKEYQVTNNTSGNILDISWQHTMKPERIFNTKQDIDAGVFPIKSSAFNGMAYANFVPGFVATYQASMSKTGKSTFTVKSNVLVYGLAHYISPYLSDKDSAGRWHSASFATEKLIPLTDSFTVDWDSPYFRTELPVAIKAYKHQQLYCLTMEGEHQPVLAKACNRSKNQTWGLTSQGEYIILHCA